jgi:hypothetical protein
MASLATGMAAAAVIGTSGALYITGTNANAKPAIPPYPTKLPYDEDRNYLWYSAFSTGDTDQIEVNKVKLFQKAMFEQDANALNTYQYYYNNTDEQFVPWDGGFLFSERDKADYRSGIDKQHYPRTYP